MANSLLYDICGFFFVFVLGLGLRHSLFPLVFSFLILYIIFF